jgi:hypothetical protein
VAFESWGGLGWQRGRRAVGEDRGSDGMRLSHANELPEDSTDGDEVDCATDKLDGDELALWHLVNRLVPENA